MLYVVVIQSGSEAYLAFPILGNLKHAEAEFSKMASDFGEWYQRGYDLYLMGPDPKDSEYEFPTDTVKMEVIKKLVHQKK